LIAFATVVYSDWESVFQLTGGTDMTKELHCRDVGPDCDAVVTSESEDEIVTQVAEHAKSVHGMTDEQVRDPVFVAHVREQIHEQEK
jgi:predicted small metal-binding protein